MTTSTSLLSSDSAKCKSIDGATALVVCGTTGEAPTLTPAEHNRIVRIAVEVAHGRVPVIAGAGSNSTSQAIEFAKDAEAAGADAILSVVPYYNKPMQAGMEAHFRAIANATGLPIMLYDVPVAHSVQPRGCNDRPSGRESAIHRPEGCDRRCERLPRLRALLGTDFRLLSGDDRTAFAFIAQGGHGCISVTSNVAPGLCRSMYLALKREQTGLAVRIATVITTLTEALFRESNPGPVKSALDLLNIMPARVRLPLVEPSQETKAELAVVLTDICDRYPDWIAGRLTPIMPAVSTARRMAQSGFPSPQISA